MRNLLKSTLALEKKLKRLAIKTLLEHYGKGPEEAWVKINRNVAAFYCSKIITPLEESLLKVPNGKEEILILREKIYIHIKPQIILELEKILNCKVLSIATNICLETRTLHGSILFLHDLEKDIGGV